MSVSSTNLFKKAVNLEISPQFDAYTGVRILTGIQDEDGNDIVYFAGNENGRVLEVSNAWGTQTQANNILASIQGRSYKPYTADGTIIDPAAELNDGVTVNGVYSGICTKTTRFGTLMDADISAPQDQEIDHEYSFETSQDRKFTRQVKEFKSELKIQASQISARVSSSGGGQSSFGWVLTDTDHSWYSGQGGTNGNLVMKVDASGLMVAGTIRARTFETLDGQQLATTDQLNAIRTSTAASWGTGNSGFVGALHNGINFADMAQNGKAGTYTANWIVANHIACYPKSDHSQTISGTHYGGWYDDNDVYHACVWASKSIPDDVTVTLRPNGVYYVYDEDDIRRTIRTNYVVESAYLTSTGSSITYLGGI